MLNNEISPREELEIELKRLERILLRFPKHPGVASQIEKVKNKIHFLTCGKRKRQLERKPKTSTHQRQRWQIEQLKIQVATLEATIKILQEGNLPEAYAKLLIEHWKLLADFEILRKRNLEI